MICKNCKKNMDGNVGCTASQLCIQCLRTNFEEYRDFFITNWGRCYLINRKEKWDYYQIPFDSPVEAKQCIDTMISTNKEAFYEGGRVIYR